MLNLRIGAASGSLHRLVRSHWRLMVSCSALRSPATHRPANFNFVIFFPASGWLRRLVRRSFIRRWYGVSSVYHWAMLQMDTRYSMGVLSHSQAPRNHNEHRTPFEMQQTRARLCSDPVPRDQLSICHARQSQSAQSPNLEL
jgi:hypothetical protein